MWELSLVGNLQGEKKLEKKRIKKEINSVHIGYSDLAIGIKGLQF